VGSAGSDPNRVLHEDDLAEVDALEREYDRYECCRVGEGVRASRLRGQVRQLVEREWVTQHAVTGDLAGECREGLLLVTDAPEVTAVTPTAVTTAQEGGAVEPTRSLLSAARSSCRSV
jgi:hypothetical protein